MRVLDGLTLLVPLVLVVACSRLPTAPATPAVTSRYHTLQTAPQPQASISPVLQVFPFLAAANLSDAQESQILSLLQQQPSLPGQDAQQQLAQQWKNLLTSPTLDTDALKTFLQARAREAQAQQKQAQALLAAVRDLLTPEQRTAVGANIRQAISTSKQQTAMQAQPSPEPTPELGLTAEQQGLFQAAEPSPDPVADEASGQALADFFAGGNQQAFEASAPSEASADAQLDAMIKAYASLSQQQRTTLVNYQPSGMQDQGAEPADAAP